MSDRRFISRLTAASFHHPGKFLLVALALSLAGAWLASRLEVRSSFEELLPPDLASVKHAKELARRVGGDGNVLVNVEALDGPEGLPRAEAMADRLAKAYRALGPKVIRSVESNLGPVERWYEDHWPLFADLADLEQAREKLVSAIGEAKARANPMVNLLDEDEEPAREPPIEVKDPLLDPSQPSPRAKVAKDFARYPDGFMVHPDHRSVTIVVRPTGTSLGVSEARQLLDRMREVASGFRPELEAQHLRVGFAGSFANMVAEYEAIVGNVFTTFAIVMALVMLSVLLFYRRVRPVLALGVAVMVGVAVTFGLTWLVIGYLNTQTAFLGSIVVGNGINYGLIYLARVGQLRRRGVALEEACQAGAREATQGTLLASVATSVSFGTLIIASNRGFRHFGFIGGVGMLLCWLATFSLLPAILVVYERLRPERPRPPAPTTERRELAFLEKVFARPRLIIGAFAAVTAVCLAVFVARLPTLLERNLNNLTNDATGDAELRRDHDRANSALGKSIAGVVALLPSRDAADGYCRAIRERVRESPRLQQLISGCDTVATVLPAQQEAKLRVIADIRSRLTDRVLGRLPPDQAARARELRQDLAAQRPVSAEEAPQVLLDRFREKDGTLGRLAFVGAKPDAWLELAANMRDFVAGVRNVPVDGGKYDAAGETVVLADLLADIEHEGPRTTLLSFAGVCVLVLLFFRVNRRSALLVAALTAGVVVMAGVATALGIKINFFNFIAYPITFGIAVDYGANVIARIDARRTVLPALLEVGPAVVLCSWTTIVGYGSLLLSINRALRSFGWYAMLGEFTTLLSALLLIPAVDLAFARRRAEAESPPVREEEAAHGE